MNSRWGLAMVLADHVETWSIRTGKGLRQDRKKAFGKYYLMPLLFALPFFFFRFDLQGVGQLLSGVAVFTALLFGLLILMFNTGLTLRKDSSSFKNAHNLKRTVSDLRANVTYAAVVAITLALILSIAAGVTTPATSTNADQGLGWGWTPPVVWLFIHLGLTLLTILRRLRTAFNYATR